MRTRSRLPIRICKAPLVALLVSVAACTTVDVPRTTTTPAVQMMVTTDGNAATALPYVVEPTATLALIPPTPPKSPTATASPTSSVPLPVAENPPVCSPTDRPDARFIQDLSVADGTRLAPGTAFRKTWQIRNTGSCTWPSGTELVLISGTPLPGPQRIPVSSTWPKNEVAVSVDLVSPDVPGHYTNYWRLQAPETGLFGAVLFIDIVVDLNAPDVTLPSTVMPTATAVPLATATPLPTPTCSPPSPTATPEPAPTATPETPQDNVAYCNAPDQRFHTIINQATPLGIRVLCATAPVKETSGSLQTFWADIEGAGEALQLRSMIILRLDTNKTYVIQGKDADTYVAEVTQCQTNPDIDPEEAPSECAPLVPPEGYAVPTGSIGDCWCRNSLWASIGWPSEASQSVSLEIQETGNGLLIKATPDLQNDAVAESRQTTLIAVDFDTMTATVQRVLE